MKYLDMVFSAATGFALPQIYFAATKGELTTMAGWTITALVCLFLKTCFKKGFND